MFKRDHQTLSTDDDYAIIECADKLAVYAAMHTREMGELLALLLRLSNSGYSAAALREHLKKLELPGDRR
jgi:hypothetical protein